MNLEKINALIQVLRSPMPEGFTWDHSSIGRLNNDGEIIRGCALPLGERCGILKQCSSYQEWKSQLGLETDEINEFYSMPDETNDRSPEDCAQILENIRDRKLKG